MDYHDREFKIVAKTSLGLEEVLEEEIKELGISKIEKGNRAITFYANKKQLYKANLKLRTANRLLMPIKTFKIETVEDLYNKIKKIKWYEIFDVNQTFSIDSTVFSPLFNHTQFAAFKTKDAIVDLFRDKYNKRPDVDKDFPHIRINIHINKINEVTVSLDSSGDPLFKRGYRDSRSIAPIKEDLAAGLILLSGWKRDCNFIDFFCGSGTLLIEATYYAYNIAPNINREEFGFFNWKSFDKELFNEVVDECLAQENNFDYSITGIEIDGRTLGMARANIKSAGLTKEIELIKSDFIDFTPPPAPGIVVCNPPYGERIGENVDELYSKFGDILKDKYADYNAWMISSNMGALKKVGLRPSRKIKVMNGNLECRFMKYEMYRGTKKIHKLKD